MSFSTGSVFYARGLIFYRQGIPSNSQVSCPSFCCCCCPGCSDDEQEKKPLTEKVTNLANREIPLIQTQNQDSKNGKK